MQIILLNIAVGMIIYTIFLVVLLYRDKAFGRRRGKNDEGDDEGGIPVSLPPDFDLPPGVCLPDDPKALKLMEADEIYA
jgi:hypothetical protein